MNILDGGLEQVPGYKFSALQCGIRYENRLDYALIYSEHPCNAAGMFTTNKLPAAPVKLCRERINNAIHGILINSTNANACTGIEGYNNAVSLTDETAGMLGVDKSSILMASTGIIGERLPIQKMRDSIPALVDGLSKQSGRLVSEAIMTTDTVIKTLALSFSCRAGEFKIAGTAKGSGMIAPNMATLLCFIITDFPVEKEDLKEIFERCVKKTLNSITIDGDMSTNDTAIILSPSSKQNINEGMDLEEFEEALLYLLDQLSEMLVMDGEGTTKVVRVKVCGAVTEDDAWRAAKAVSESVLVKTAFFGRDPNWGRIGCAVGYSGAEVKEERMSIFFDDIQLLQNGEPCQYNRKELDDVLARKGFSILIDLGLGKSEASYLTTDLSYEYVKINAEYST